MTVNPDDIHVEPENNNNLKDSIHDAWAAVGLILLVVATAVFWVSSQ